MISSRLASKDGFLKPDNLIFMFDLSIGQGY
jgi:hypothetical protein